MKNIIKFLFIVVSSAFVVETVMAMEQGNEPLYLVVGSTRKEALLSPWRKAIYKSDNQDFSHINTFSGKATTIDLFPCELKEVPELPHIQTNILTFTPERPIGGVFMELLPSSDVTYKGKKKEVISSENIEEQTNKLLFLPNVINHIARYMIPGSTLAIEQQPIIVGSNNINFYLKMMPLCAVANPFTHVLSPLYYETFKAYLKPEEKRNNYWARVNNALITKYPNQEVSEVRDLVAYAQESVSFLTQAIEAVQKLLPNISKEKIQNRISSEMAIYEKKQETFDLSQMLLGTIIEEMHMIMFQERVKEFLVEAGFEAIEVKRVEINPYNGRKNSWIISAVKSGAK